MTDGYSNTYFGRAQHLLHDTRTESVEERYRVLVLLMQSALEHDTSSALELASCRPSDERCHLPWWLYDMVRGSLKRFGEDIPQRKPLVEATHAS